MVLVFHSFDSPYRACTVSAFLREQSTRDKKGKTYDLKVSPWN